jgi:heme oxygenase
MRRPPVQPTPFGRRRHGTPEPTVTAPLAKPTLTLRAALRTSTHSLHEALDGALMPPRTAWTRDRYRRFLRGTLAVVATLEPALAALLPDVAPIESPPRGARLRRDLSGLGDAADVVLLATPNLASRAGAFGTAYVLEGSMLGGQHVAQALSRDLALDDAGLTYLRPPGVAIGPRWQAFVAALDAFGAAAPPADWRAAETAAAATFTAFTDAFRREGLF